MTMETRRRNAVITLAAVLTGATAVAQGQVTIYGVVGTTVRHVTNAGAQGKNVVDDGAFYQSRLGFQGKEDLGDGFSAIFNLEMGLDPTTGSLQPAPTSTSSYSQSPAPTGRGFGRQSFVGLAGNWGTLTLGRQYTFAHTLSGRFQPQTNPNLAALSAFPQWHVARWDNMLRYEATIGPFGAGASVAANEGNGKSSSVAGWYRSGPAELSAYYETMQANATATDTRKVAGLGGTYAILPSLKAYLGAMKRTQSTSTVENKVWTSGLLFNATDLLELTASFTSDHQSAFGTTAKGRRNIGFVSAEYRFSKRTSVYAEVDRNDVTGGYALPNFMGVKGKQTGASLGIQHRF